MKHFELESKGFRADTIYTQDQVSPFDALNVSDLNDGMYFLVLTLDDKTIVEQVIKK